MIDIPMLRRLMTQCGMEDAIITDDAFRLAKAIYSEGKAESEQENETASWKNAHADLVKRNALLRERPDLPVDRLPAYKQLTEDIDRLKSMLEGIISCWNEFGDARTLSEHIDAAERHLQGLPPVQYEVNL